MLWRWRHWKRRTKARVALACRVYRDGLPEAFVTYEVFEDEIRFAVCYEGRTFGTIEGEDYWAVNGRFAVEQRFAEHIRPVR